MSDMMRLLVRLFSIAFGFFLGCVAAALAYVFLARLIVPADFGRIDELELTVTLAIGVFGVASIFARAVLLPALTIIAVFEFMRLRDWLSHALAGAVLALAIAGLPYVSGYSTDTTDTLEPAMLIAIRTACAIIGASVYWLLTGRNAGRWLPSERAGPVESDT
ncbi:hypothetical protein ACK6D9_02025 [Hoeflea sp. Naph1]|uniref:hypothetical protein n=1 Tax=Hoeflea sp. Naph1 TaxID=3388653 RepID=UPI00399001CB